MQLVFLPPPPLPPPPPPCPPYPPIKKFQHKRFTYANQFNMKFLKKINNYLTFIPPPPPLPPLNPLPQPLPPPPLPPQPPDIPRLYLPVLYCSVTDKLTTPSTSDNIASRFNCGTNQTKYIAKQIQKFLEIIFILFFRKTLIITIFPILNLSQTKTNRAVKTKEMSPPTHQR